MARGPQGLRRQGPGHEAVRGGHHHRRVPLGQGVQRRQTAPLPVPRTHGPGAELPLPAQQGHGAAARQGLQISGEDLDLPLVPAEEHRRTAAGCRHRRAHAGWEPLTAAGQPPSSTRRISSAASGIVCNCLRNCSIGCGPCQHEKLGRLSGRRAASGRMARWAFSARRLFGGRGCKADGHDSPTQVISTGTIRENGSVLSVFPFTGRHARRQRGAASRPIGRPSFN